MAAKLEELFTVKPELVGSGGGIFDVVVDKELVYSKFKEGGFPDEEQLIAELTAKYGV